MITNVSHVGIWVLDQDEALDFYVNKLGFSVHTDIQMDDFRWLTISPPNQPDLQIILSVPKPPMVDEATAEQLKTLVAEGHLGGGIFHTEDCRATYEELKARGVEFTEEPTERFYGIDCAFRDNFGNPWRITQPLPYPRLNPPKEG